MRRRIPVIPIEGGGGKEGRRRREEDKRGGGGGKIEGVEAFKQ